METHVMGIMKNANMAPEAGIEPTSLAIRASVLIITPPRFPYVNTILTPACICSSLPGRLVQNTTLASKSFNTYNYIHKGSDFTYTNIG